MIQTGLVGNFGLYVKRQKILYHTTLHHISRDKGFAESFESPGHTKILQ